MNPHKKTLIDEASGIEYENQRYLDYEEGRRGAFGEVDSIIKRLLKEIEYLSNRIVDLIGKP